MKKTALTLLTMALSLVSVNAGEVSALVNKLAEKGIITYGEAAQIAAESEEGVRAKTAKAENTALPLWIQRVALTGDVRVRAQVDENTAAQATRVRGRARVRLGLETVPMDRVKAGIGIATGSFGGSGDKNPASTNHTFHAFNKSPLYLDYAYLSYEPIYNLVLTGGKIKNKTQAWSPSDLLWDTDINPDGVALNYQTANLEYNFFANAGWYMINEQGNETVGLPYGYIVQPGFSFDNLSLSFKAAVGYQSFDLKDKPTGSNEPGKWLGAVPDNNFNIITPAAEVMFRNILMGYSVGAFGEYAKNLYHKVRDGGREAWLFGLSFGDEKVDLPGTWQIKGMYRRLGANAIPLGLGDADAYGGAAGKGYEVTFAYALVRNLQFNFDFYNMRDIDGNNLNRLYQFDLVYKF